MKSTPWLSVIIPTYQGEDFLGYTLDSIVSQWSNDIEVIAIDDGSTDATIRILEKYRSDIDLNLLDNVHTGNWVINSNKALNEATGKYICMLHQDDLWLPTRIEALRKATAEFPDAGMFVNPSKFINDAGKELGHWNIPLQPNIPLDAQQVLIHLIVQNFFALPAPVFTREIWQKIADMDESLWFLADWKLWGSIAAETKTVILPEILTAYRVHPASQTTQRTNNAEDLRRQYENVIASMADILEEGKTKQQSIKAAKLNTAVCISMALWSHKKRIAALREFLKHSFQRPSVWQQFFKDSRIRERLGARLKN